jgi:sulfite reductase (NADPH) flavoprotein alpha-component
MLRQIHKLPGLIAGLLVVVLATSGTILSVIPALDRSIVPPSSFNQMNVAEMAGRIAKNYPGAEQIKRSPSGKITVFYFKNDNAGADLIDPATGAKVAAYQPSGFVRWLKLFHRSLLFDNKGRAVAGFGALAMIILSFSGLMMTAKRQGGWKNLFKHVRGTGTQRWHVTIGRVAVFGFLFSSLTAIYMSLVTFAYIPDGVGMGPNFPTDVNGGATMNVADMAVLKDVNIADFRSLSFPYAGDPTDVFTLSTAQGTGYIDQATGKMLSYEANSFMKKTYEFIFMLHTGQGLWWLGLILGAAASVIPIMSITGTLMWLRNRRAAPRIKKNISAKHADIVVLVGSESSSTWGFAKTLHDGLTAEGLKVHTAPMNRLKPEYKSAKSMFILTATYGDGEAPVSAKSFMKQLAAVKTTPSFPVAVLGFGDRQFPRFCQFAQDVSAALDAKQWKHLLPLDMIDRQSAQEFSRWGREIGAVLGFDLELVHTPALRKTNKLALISRVDYGAEVQAPTTVFRFGVPEAARKGLFKRIFGRRLPKFDAGDLVGVLVPGSTVPRFYSLASSAKEGALEICVRKQAGGLCSGFLHDLAPGDEIEAFIQPNPDFRPASGRAPVILIGAGTGIGPLAGFIRSNNKRRPMHLYFGGRDPKSDFLYEPELRDWLDDKRLGTLNTAFSRVQNRSYVQNRIVADAEMFRDLIAQGAQILVCGGRSMAQGVLDAIETVLEPTDLDILTLKTQGRYVEDTY